jgi:hypothetical protein
MLSIRIVTAGAVLAFAVSAAAAQDNDAPSTPISLLKILTPSSEATEAKATPQAKLEAKRVATKTIRTARRFHHHATHIAIATEDPSPTSEPTPAPATEQTPSLEPASWSAQAAIDAAPPSMWPAGNAPIFAGVLDSEPQVVSAAPSLSSDQNTATPTVIDAPPAPAPVVALAEQDDGGGNRDVWFEEILATLGGALAAGSVAWFLFGAAPARMYG